MSIERLFVLACCFVFLDFSEAADSKSADKRKKAALAPRKLNCTDKDLQRTVSWRKPRRLKKGWELEGYWLEFCSAHFCTFRPVHCYEDDQRQTRIYGYVTERSCKTSVKQMIPYPFYSYRVRAIYRHKINKTKVKNSTASKQKICQPVQSQMTLDAPLLSYKSSTTTIEVNSTLPPGLTSAIENSNGFDMRIIYSFCLYKKGESCETGGRLKNDSCNSITTFALLEPGTEYEISVWYTSSVGKGITSEVSKTMATTAKDWFPTIIAISIIFAVILIVLIIARMIYREMEKWSIVILKEESPEYRHLLEKLKEITKNPGNQALVSRDPEKRLDLPPLRAHTQPLHVTEQYSQLPKSVVNDTVAVPSAPLISESEETMTESTVTPLSQKNYEDTSSNIETSSLTKRGSSSSTQSDDVAPPYVMKDDGRFDTVPREMDWGNGHKLLQKRDNPKNNSVQSSESRRQGSLLSLQTATPPSITLSISLRTEASGSM